MLKLKRVSEAQSPETRRNPDCKSELLHNHFSLPYRHAIGPYFIKIKPSSQPVPLEFAHPIVDFFAPQMAPRQVVRRSSFPATMAILNPLRNRPLLA
ncbi:MAG: hypothetical protein K9J37_03455 [Saprospiraceae bacterium]|nr:hypothetical protein [Saprospiraceae bacterium]MCF8248939.1 hypothetical protein [Saprospiraceae bacterium]MCF8279150.1 hypothetical protein [Bacteroidales bacterium]MCF8310833.1 hypothetical protein [Saprospiraceae bacterium]MCF8439579.1 hypothetical protein [Saprospiraceae bacterium]